MNLSIITAFDQNQVIGNDQKLPWHIPEDLAYFKTTTLNHPIIMGRKTFESIGKPLPKRTNIVISSSLKRDDIIILDSPDQIFSLDLDSAFIIGGASLYQYFLPKCTLLYVTHIDGKFTGNIHFPKINWEEWTCISETKSISGSVPIRFCIYKRIKDH